MHWFTSDLHLDHANIVGYCRRPFPDVKAMADGLAERWETVVQPTDDVWVLGDLTLRNPCPDGVPVGWLEAFVSGLPGRKHLVLGNHDRGWADGRVRDGWAERYRRLGFVDVAISEACTVAGRRVWLAHLPAEPGCGGVTGEKVDDVVWDRACPDRADRACWRLCGHVHGAWRQHGRQINVGVDAWAGFPVGEDELGLLFDAGPAEREVLTWQEQAGMTW